jgi:hypothetical protein
VGPSRRRLAIAGRRLQAAGAALVLVTAGARVASAAPARPVLVELFTSQGCSSCPAADEFVRELPRLGLGPDRVVPLTFHVDYWDDLGWKDPFAVPAFTVRQRDYARAGTLASPVGEDGLSGLYTPQMIVDGRVHFSGARRDVALAEIARAAARPSEAELVAGAEATATEVRVRVQVRVLVAHPDGPRAPAPGPAAARWVLRVALTAREEQTRVVSGENRGRVLTEVEVVRALSPPLPVERQHGAPVAGALDVTLPRPDALSWDAVHLVAFIQSADNHRVIATTRVPISVQSPASHAIP